MNELVAVYGSLRQGMGNHGVISDNEYVAQTTLSGDYRMVSLGGFPGVMKTSNPTSPIIIEVYRVTDEHNMRRLDSLEGYRGPGQNNFYDKELVTLDNGMQAYIYLLDEDEYGSYAGVDHGDWVKFKSNQSW